MMVACRESASNGSTGLGGGFGTPLVPKQSSGRIFASVMLVIQKAVVGVKRKGGSDGLDVHLWNNNRVPSGRGSFRVSLSGQRRE